jgi:hypothetical protein
MSDSKAVLAGRAGNNQAGDQSDFANSTTGLGTVVERAHAAMTHAHSEFVRHLTTIPRELYSDDGVREAIAGFSSSQAARAVDLAVDHVRQRRDDAQDQLSRVRQELSPDGDTAAELRAGRFWNRTKGLLDSVDNSGLLSRTQDLLATASRTELGTLLQELAPYLISRGQATDWLDSVVAEIAPEFGHAREQLRTADQALQIAKFNANALRRAFREGRLPSVIVNPRNYDPDRIG